MIPAIKKEGRAVESAQMQSVYEQLKTPYKYGAVMKFDGRMCDSPTVFQYNNRWYMSFIQIDNEVQNSGYDSHLAVSDDLLSWEYLGTTLTRNDCNHWDSKQIACYAAFVENNFKGEYRLQKVNGAYHFAYLGGNLNGYETDPLYMGQCKTPDVLTVSAYEKQEKPVLSPFDADARKGETRTLYKAYMFIDEVQTLGYRYVNAYNAKDETNKESIFLAVSKDGEKWERYGDSAIIVDDSPEKNITINGDPQILKIGDVYVMLYFIFQGGKAFNTFACSYDLVNWTKWNGKPLVESECEWENKFAHKPWVVVRGDVVYHFYCAVNHQGERFIALATSKEV